MYFGVRFVSEHCTHTHARFPIKFSWFRLVFMSTLSCGFCLNLFNCEHFFLVLKLITIFSLDSHSITVGMILTCITLRVAVFCSTVIAISFFIMSNLIVLLLFYVVYCFVIRQQISTLVTAFMFCSFVFIAFVVGFFFTSHSWRFSCLNSIEHKYDDIIVMHAIHIYREVFISAIIYLYLPPFFVTIYFICFTLHLLSAAFCIS